MYEDDDQALARRAARVSRANLRKPPRHGDAPRSTCLRSLRGSHPRAAAPKSRPATPCCPRDRAATETSGIAARPVRVPFAGARPRDCHAGPAFELTGTRLARRDGRVHTESTRPPLSVWLVLVTEATDVAERRELSALPGVPCRAVRVSGPPYDWWCRQPDVGAYFGRLRALVDSCPRDPAGREEPRSRPFARCPNTLDLGEHTRTCGGPLYPRRRVLQSSGARRVGGLDRPEWAASGCCLRSA